MELGLGGTTADDCITACFMNCSLVSNLQAQHLLDLYLLSLDLLLFNPLSLDPDPLSLHPDLFSFRYMLAVGSKTVLNALCICIFV